MQEPNNPRTPTALAAALRCSAAPLAPEHSCKGCPYYVSEDVPGNYIAQLGDVWTWCDVDRMARDAADMIERLAGEVPNAQ